MKKKIVFLFLLILAGMGIFLSQGGWCGSGYPGKFPWEPAFNTKKVIPTINVQQSGSIDMNVGNSASDMNIPESKTIIRRGGRDFNNLNRTGKEKYRSSYYK